jgi:hypothetical protein
MCFQLLPSRRITWADPSYDYYVMILFILNCELRNVYCVRSLIWNSKRKCVFSVSCGATSGALSMKKGIAYAKFEDKLPHRNVQIITYFSFVL